MPLGTVTFEALAQGTNVALTVTASGMTKIVSIERLTPPGTQLGTGTIVRGTADADATGGLWRGNDFEAPNGVPLEYVVTAEGDSPADQAEVRVVVDDVIDYGGDYLMPVGYPQLGFVVNVEYGGMGGLVRGVQRDIAPVLNRRDPVVVSFGRQAIQGTITFLTLDDSGRESMLPAMNAPVVMFAARPGFGFPEPLFISPGPVTEARTVGLGSEQSRRWEIPFVQVARPPALYGSDLPSTDWQARFDSGDTWQTVKNTNVIWFDYAGFRT